MWSDILYFSTLILSIPLGRHYKSIEDREVKRNYGTGLGIIICCLVCERNVVHIFLMIAANSAILKCCNKRYVHHFSLIYTWLHLLYLHIHLINTAYTICIIQCIALRLVGLAFEKSNAERPVKFASTSRIGDTENVALDPDIADIISYSVFFIGLHKGPYYRFKIFKEHLGGSFGNLGDCRIITEHKITKIAIYLAGYLMLRSRYSPKILLQPKFYKYDADTRYLYNIPLLMLFILRNQIVMLLCTSVCTEAGFGVYPARCLPLPGHGPSVRHSLLEFSHSFSGWVTDAALKEEYNFSTIRCYDKKKLLLGPRMKETIRSWDMPTRYWFWSYIYKNWIKANREIRSACSYLAWTLWIGPSLQHLIVSSTLWVYTRIETEYVNLYDTNGPMKLAWNIGFSIMRMFCLLYLTPCFLIKDAKTILLYYNSIFWVIHIILLVLLVGAVVAYKSREHNCSVHL